MKTHFRFPRLPDAYTPARLFVQGAVLIVSGILIRLHPSRFLSLALLSCQLGLGLGAAAALLDSFAHPVERRSFLLKALALLCGCAATLLFPKALGTSLALLFGVWIAVNALFKFVYAIQLRHDRQRGVFGNVLGGLIHTLFAVMLLTSPLQALLPLSEWMGLYLVVYGSYSVVDGFRELLGTDINGKRVRQRIRLSPPVLLSSLIPMGLLRALDDPDDAAETARWTRRETNDQTATRDLEIFLHLSKNTAMGFGHVDIALGNRVYAYGCYDESSNRLFGLLSDGVLMEVNRNRYLPFCLGYEKKKLISYGVTLTDAQISRLQQTVADFLQGSVRWTPQPGSVSYAFSRQTGAAFYKLQNGPFKTYNALKTNCVALASLLCGASGVDLMNLQGIVTPGSYYVFLDRQFRRPNSIVISRTVYR